MTAMKCPHCDRTWTPADLDTPLPASLVLQEHVRRFCPGEPRSAREQRPRRKALVAHG